MPMQNNSIFIFDFDDVLVDFSSLHYSFIRSNWKTYSRWYVDKGNLTTPELQDRPFYRMFEWLVQKRYEALTSKQYTTLYKSVSTYTKNTFFKTDIYLNAQPTEFARKTLMNKMFMDNKLLKKS